MQLQELLRLDPAQLEKINLREEISLLIELRSAFGLNEVLTLPQFVDFLQILHENYDYEGSMRDLLDNLAIKKRFTDQKSFMEKNPIGSTVYFNPETFKVVDLYGIILNSNELSSLGISCNTPGIVVSYSVTGFVEVSFHSDEYDDPISLDVPLIYLASSN